MKRTKRWRPNGPDDDLTDQESDSPSESDAIPMERDSIINQPKQSLPMKKTFLQRKLISSRLNSPQQTIQEPPKPAQTRIETSYLDSDVDTQLISSTDTSKNESRSSEEDSPPEIIIPDMSGYSIPTPPVSSDDSDGKISSDSDRFVESVQSKKVDKTLKKLVNDNNSQSSESSESEKEEKVPPPKPAITHKPQAKSVAPKKQQKLVLPLQVQKPNKAKPISPNESESETDDTDEIPLPSGQIKKVIVNKRKTPNYAAKPKYWQTVMQVYEYFNQQIDVPTILTAIHASAGNLLVAVQRLAKDPLDYNHHGDLLLHSQIEASKDQVQKYLS